MILPGYCVRRFSREARRESEEIVSRARQDAEDLLAAAAVEASRVREEQLDRARAEAARRRELILATVPVETGRLRVVRIESLLESVHEEARRAIACPRWFSISRGRNNPCRPCDQPDGRRCFCGEGTGSRPHPARRRIMLRRSCTASAGRRWKLPFRSIRTSRRAASSLRMPGPARYGITDFSRGWKECGLN